MLRVSEDEKCALVTTGEVSVEPHSVVKNNDCRRAPRATARRRSAVFCGSAAAAKNSMSSRSNSAVARASSASR